MYSVFAKSGLSHC